MKMQKYILSAVICASSVFAGCATKHESQLPRVSTAAVSNNLNQLADSLASANQNVQAIQGKLSEIDAKAVRIQESIRHW